MVADADGSALTLTATADDATLLPASGITVGGAGPNRLVSLTPVAGQRGTAHRHPHGE